MIDSNNKMLKERANIREYSNKDYVSISNEVYQCGGTQLIGSEHKKLNIPCRAAYSIAVNPDGWIALAIADIPRDSESTEERSRSVVKAISEYWGNVSSAFNSPNDIKCLLMSSLNFALKRINISEGDITNKFLKLEVALIIPNKQICILDNGGGNIFAILYSKEIELISEENDQKNVPSLLANTPEAWHYKIREINDVESIVLVTGEIAGIIKKSEKYEMIKQFANFTNSGTEHNYYDYCKKILSNGNDLCNIDNDVTIVYFKQLKKDNSEICSKTNYLKIKIGKINEFVSGYKKASGNRWVLLSDIKQYICKKYQIIRRRNAQWLRLIFLKKTKK